MKKQLLVILLLVTLIITGCQSEPEVVETIEQKTAVEVAPLEIGKLYEDIILTGKIQPINTVTLLPQIAGMETVTGLNVKLGDYVEKETLLVKLDEENTKDSIESLRLSYTSALRNYQSTYEAIANAKINFERTKELYEAGAASKQAYEAAELQASDAQLNVLKSQVDQAKFAYDNAKTSLENTEILAPIAGIVSDINFTDSGLATTQSTITITDISILKIEVDITERLINEIAQGDAVRVQMPMVSDDTYIDGTITSLNVVPDMRTGLYKAVIEMPNEESTYKPGMVAKIHISLGDNIESYIVNQDAVLSDDSGSYIYQLNGEKVTKVYVTTGESNGEVIEITGEINDNFSTIIKGQEFLNDGDEVIVLRGQ